MKRTTFFIFWPKLSSFIDWCYYTQVSYTGSCEPLARICGFIYLLNCLKVNLPLMFHNCLSGNFCFYSDDFKDGHHCKTLLYIGHKGLLWSWFYGSWIYNYLCNQCLTPLNLWVRTTLRWVVLYATLCDKVCQWPATCRWFSLVSSTNITKNIVESGIKHHKP